MSKKYSLVQQEQLHSNQMYLDELSPAISSNKLQYNQQGENKFSYDQQTLMSQQSMKQLQDDYIKQNTNQSVASKNLQKYGSDINPINQSPSYSIKDRQERKTSYMGKFNAAQQNQGFNQNLQEQNQNNYNQQQITNNTQQSAQGLQPASYSMIPTDSNNSPQGQQVYPTIQAKNNNNGNLNFQTFSNLQQQQQQQQYQQQQNFNDLSSYGSNRNIEVNTQTRKYSMNASNVENQRAEKQISSFARNHNYYVNHMASQSPESLLKRKPQIGILKNSMISQQSLPTNMSRSRIDSYGKQIFPSSRRHQIAFKEKLCEVETVENWKEYNVIEESEIESNCNCILI